MTESTNAYCHALGIAPPSVEAVVGHREASTYALLLVALLEHGAPMTLVQVAERLARAGAGNADDLLRSLQRSRPGRAPLYRDGDHYDLDPYDDEVDLWAFRLGLRPPRAPRVDLVRPEPPPLPDDDVPLRPEELDEVFRDPEHWSTQRRVLMVLDSVGGSATRERIEARLAELGTSGLAPTSHDKWSSRAITFENDGTWTADLDHEQLRTARRAVRTRLRKLREWNRPVRDPAVAAAHARARERRRESKIAELEALRRCILHAPALPDVPACAFADLQTREVRVLLDEQLDELGALVARYDWLGAVEVRPLVRRLGLPTETLRLIELGPPQKTLQLGATVLQLTPDLLVRSACRIRRPFGTPAQLQRYAAKRQLTRLVERLEADARSLVTYHDYARLHGSVPIGTGRLAELLPIPWVHRDERGFRDLLAEACEQQGLVDAVIGQAPEWDDPWARAETCVVLADGKYSHVLVDRHRNPIDPWDVQLLRLTVP